MNEYERLRRLAERHRQSYPKGTRLMLLSMDDPYSPVPPGTRGSVEFIDDMAQIFMHWDNGRTLPLNSDVDSFRKLTAEELAEEQENEIDEDNGPSWECEVKRKTNRKRSDLLWQSDFLICSRVSAAFVPA